jgi:hypothetical protein
MIYSRLVAFTFLLLSCLLSHAQYTVVKGEILDKESGETLPFATVMFTASSTGTTTDLDGKFTLETNNPLYDQITVSYVGYEPKDVKISPGKVNERVIKLKEIKLELETVEVRAKRKVPKDTAAIELYKKVVQNKYRNDPSQYDYFSFLDYSKTEFGLYDVSEKFKERKVINKLDFILENIEILEDGTEVLPILLKESSKQVYFRKSDRKRKEILLGNRFSGVDNNSLSDLIDLNFESIEIYHNLIPINGKPLMSPFADNARLSYKYFLTDTADFDGLTCYKLEFTGRGNADAAFTGHAWIHDSTYAIQSIRLIILANASLNFVSDFITEQKFALIDGKYWFMDYEFMQTQYNIFKKKGEEKQSFLVRKTDKRTEISVNQEIDAGLLTGEENIIIDGARDQQDEFWDSVRVDALNEREANIFKTVDSLKSTRFYKTIRWFTYLVSSGWIDARYVEFGKFYQLYSFNEVEGGRFRLSMRTRPNLSKRINVGGHFAYGLKDETWKYGSEVRLHLRRKNEKWHMLGMQHQYDMAQLEYRNKILRPSPPEYDNIGLSLLRKDPLTDLFLLRYSTIWWEREWIKGMNTRLGFEHKIHYSVPTGKEFITAEGVTDTVIVNDFTTSVIDFTGVWSKDMKFYDADFKRFPVTNTNPLFSVEYRAGIKGLLKGDYNFHSLRFNVRQRLLGPIGYTVYTAEAGFVFGEVPYPVLAIHPGNGSFIYNRWSFALLKEGEFMSDRYAHLWVVHHFDGKIFDKIPGINKLRLRFLIAARALYGYTTEKNRNVFYYPEESSPLNGWYAEAGFGIENILKLLRVDFYFRATQRDKEGVDKWGVKFYISPQF